LEKLTTLILDTNRILDITPLAGLKYVSYLNLGVNNITDITPLEGLTNLSILYLHNNNISKIKALINNCDAGGLGEGDVIYLNYNPLDDEGVQEGISYLSDKGVTIYW
jgi:Leucine-rich repeat (LRR) protein